ncbi:hypothetical protein [Sphingobium subterraneum]|uniref:Flagellar basal body-associated protein FliL n=1 Tax=Sphingobium subterraneum TaxID=627688 RepID=A0A841J0D5_9SPHN|nr:hypothetical protein [Sphingobium subterraneum]MBB6124307.1 hypothetical protein [Sphingobium subterraneum]
MKKLLVLILLLVLGAGIGAGAAYGLARVMAPPPAAASHAAKPADVETVFVSAGTILVPIVTGDGSLSGYANFDVQLEVEEEKSAEVTARMPLLLHGINLRAYRTPMAAGKQKILPDLDVFSRMVMNAATEALGKGVVKRAVVMSAKPV